MRYDKSSNAYRFAEENAAIVESIPAKRCDHCRFWQHRLFDEEFRYGYCHRFPPLAVQPTSGDNCPSDWDWPMTWDDGWCGEFKKKDFIPPWFVDGAEFDCIAAEWDSVRIFAMKNDEVQLEFISSVKDPSKDFIYEVTVDSVIDMVSSGYLKVKVDG